MITAKTNIAFRIFLPCSSFESISSIFTQNWIDVIIEFTSYKFQQKVALIWVLLKYGML